MSGNMIRHSFAVCAYGDSPYLPACLRSLKAQTKASEILICTSTPSPYLRKTADEFGVPLHIRNGRPGIGPDWNYALECASGQYVTLAHQDDIYERHYTERLLKAADRWPDMTLFTTGSVTVKGHTMERYPDRVERVKELLRLPLLIKPAAHLPFVKRLVLQFGNPLMCPSCAYRKDMPGREPFSGTLRFVLDWVMLLSMARKPGRFVLDPAPLLFYRVHQGAATAACIRDDTREREETAVLCSLWPKWAARLLMRYYRSAYEPYTEQK